MTAFSDVLTYVATQASRAEVEQLFDAGNARIKVLQTVRAGETLAQLVPGESRVRITDIRPKYLSGITGTFLHFDSGRGGKQVCVIKADAQFASLARRSSYSDEIRGIPASCLELIA